MSTKKDSYFEEIAAGVYLASSSYMIEDQKGWGDEDLSKDFDFTTSAFWITTDDGQGPEGFDSIEEAKKSIA